MNFVIFELVSNYSKMNNNLGKFSKLGASDTQTYALKTTKFEMNK